MSALLDALRGPWPWWIGGIAIGAMVPLLLLLGNKHFGISSSLRHVCAALAPAGPKYFRYDWRKERWNLQLVLGIVIGGWIASAFLVDDPAPRLSAGARALFASWGLGEPDGLMPASVFDWSALASVKGIACMIVGGFLIGFGARWANGCTSGHAIMGLSLRSPGSLLAVIGFFAGGLAVSWFVLPWVLR